MALRVYLAVMAFLKMTIIYTPEIFLEPIRPKTLISCRKIKPDSESESESESGSEPDFKFDIGRSKANPVNGILEVDVTHAFVIDNDVNTSIRNKIACWSRIGKLTLEVIKVMCPGRYFSMGMIDNNGVHHHIFIDMLKKKDLVNKTSILFSKVELLVD